MPPPAQSLARFDTELPLGHSPTVADGVVYFGGYDRKIHALNALTGAPLWEFAGGAGFSTNPLVVEGRVRDRRQSRRRSRCTPSAHTERRSKVN